MVDERDSRRATHRDHASGRIRTRTPIVGVPVRVKARTIEPPLPEAVPEAFDDLTPVGDILAHIAERGVTISRDMRLAVEELIAHTHRIEQRSADRILASHSALQRGPTAPIPTRKGKLLEVAKWLGPLLVAIAGAIYAAGMRQGASESAAAERAADRRQLEQVIRSVRSLELDVSNLRGAMRVRREDPTP